VRKTAKYKNDEDGSLPPIMDDCRRDYPSHNYSDRQQLRPQLLWVPVLNIHPTTVFLPKGCVRKHFLPSAAKVFIIKTSLLSPKTPNLLERSSLLLNFQIPAMRYVQGC
jgi:hypothetical protein